MPRYPDRAPRHQAIRASTQKSLLPPQPKTSVNAPVNNTSTPNGVTFSLAGGSWSQPFSRSVRVFPPARVVPHRHFRLRIDGELQGLGVVPNLLAGRLDIGEDGVGLLRLLQGLALAEAFEPVVHAVEDVA